MDFTMWDILKTLELPFPPQNRASFYIRCPNCDREKGKHLNINMVKNVFRCARCGVKGGMFDLYALHMNVGLDSAKETLIERLGGKKPDEYSSPPTVPEVEIADIDTRHVVYSGMLEMLSLADDHRHNLRGRGLSDGEIRAREYRTISPNPSKELLRIGHSGVPGFYRKGETWRLAVPGRGILVPVRDTQRRIQGMQIRLDNTAKRKFRWLSSAEREDGCRAEGWIHIAGPVSEHMLLTEGAMKADIIYHLSGQSVVAAPGVNSLYQLELTLRELRELGLKKIMTAFDMDFLTNSYVQNGYNELKRLLDRLAIPYGTYLWRSDYKGLDDYIWGFLRGNAREE